MSLLFEVFPIRSHFVLILKICVVHVRAGMVGNWCTYCNPAQYRELYARYMRFIIQSP